MDVCTCAPSWSPWVYDRRSGKKIRAPKAFPNSELPVAKAWRRDALNSLDRGTMRTPSRETVGEALDAMIAGTKDGTVRKKKGKLFKPSTIRSYEQTNTNHLKLLFGNLRLMALEAWDVQEYVDAMVRDGEDPSTIRNRVMPLRLLYRWRRRELGGFNPTRDLELPAVEGKRERYAEPGEAVKRLELLPGEDRAHWATAFYAGLDNGELQALQVSDINLEAGFIHVLQAWDKVDGFGTTKTDARMGRKIPICEHLLQHLEPHIVGREGFAFGTKDRPYHYWTTLERANKAWKAAGLGRFTFHDARRSFRSYLDAIPAISEVRADRYMGHANPSMRARYVQQQEGQYAADAAALDEYLYGREDGTIIPIREASSA
jgi:integrase